MKTKTSKKKASKKKAAKGKSSKGKSPVSKAAKQASRAKQAGFRETSLYGIVFNIAGGSRPVTMPTLLKQVGEKVKKANASGAKIRTDNLPQAVQTIIGVLSTPDHRTNKGRADAHTKVIDGKTKKLNGRGGRSVHLKAL